MDSEGGLDGKRGGKIAQLQTRADISLSLPHIFGDHLLTRISTKEVIVFLTVFFDLKQ